jgi:hypothetical protein
MRKQGLIHSGTGARGQHAERPGTFDCSQGMSPNLHQLMILERLHARCTCTSIAGRRDGVADSPKRQTAHFT